jgi:2-amino-4-hydroxy-6-hydroxymethyldihydropteridine diphosphokinase
MKSSVYLSLGSNMGDRKKNLSEAVEMISRIDDVHVKDISRIYETDPVGYLNQDKFLNIAVKLETCAEPPVLLKYLQDIELSLKRVRHIRWGPRTIDIDILLFDDLKINTPELTIPHLRMFERAFVLIPLSEIIEQKEAADLDIEKLILQCKDKDGVKLFHDTVG